MNHPVDHLSPIVNRLNHSRRRWNSKRPLIRQATSADLVSGGGGNMEHFREAAQAGASVLLAASVSHFGIIQIPALKKFLRNSGIPVNA